MGPIQNLPAGLLGLLRITGGETPNELAGVVAPTLEALGFYAARNREFTSSSAAGITAAGAGTTLAVPVGEFWLIECLSGSVIASAAGQPMGLNIGFQLIPNAGNNIVATVPQIVSSGANLDQQRVGWVPPRLFILPPGAALTCTLERLNVGGVTVGLNAAIVRLPN